MKIIGIYNEMGTIPNHHDIPVDCDGGILFDNGYLLISHHDQDCCESVYADWGHLANEVGIMEDDFSELKIEYKKNGIVIRGRRGYFLPCYNEQNGYYNDRLDLILYDTNQMEKPEYNWWFGNDTDVLKFKEMQRWDNVPTKDEIY